ncbi:MAG: zinc metallopeptidase [Tissierellia bacterium]|nr:zinc metallopeptidase [Tissierellia bacterium]
MVYLALIVGLVISLYAQAKVRSNFEKYSEVQSTSGMTGAQVARMILDRRGIYDVSVQPVAGMLTDHYDPTSKTVRLSQGVYGQSSIAAVSVAAHEVGHAIQHNEEYAFLKFRSILAPVASFTSRFVFVLIFVGFAFEIMRLVDLGIIFFTLALLFQLVTLPVEFNASNRALYNLEDYGVLRSDEIGSSKKVLSAAALTYVAATAISALNLLRLIILRNSRNN